MVQDLQTCCCGCSLRVGVIILCVLDIVFGIYAFVDYFNKDSWSTGRAGAINLAVATVAAIAWIAGLYGAIQYKRLPIRIYFVLKVLGVIGTLITGIAVIALKDRACETAWEHAHTDMTKDNYISTCRNYAVAFGIIMILFIPVQIYFLWVIKSFENQLKQREQGLDWGPTGYTPVAYQAMPGGTYQPLQQPAYEGQPSAVPTTYV